MKPFPPYVDNQLVRPQTPFVEDTMRAAIHDALKALMEGSYLYQSKTIDLSAILEKADAKTTAADLEEEFAYRPWVPHSLHRGFSKMEHDIMGAASVGGSPLHAPAKEMRLTFPIPTIETWCSVCKSHEVHDSIPYIDASPYHLNKEAVQERPGFRTFLFNFTCAKCKSPPLTFMIRRELLKVQLCGRSKPYFPRIPTEIPKGLRDIYHDGLAAAACGDISGGFYHLRTLMEHCMKKACNIPITQQIDGSDLCEEYNKSIDPVVAGRVSLTSTFDQAAAHLHNRDGTKEQFEIALKQIEAHFKLISHLASIT